MKSVYLSAAILGTALLLPGTTLAVGNTRADCPPNSVFSGTVCMDKYEASVWRVPTPQDTRLIKKIQMGTATEVDLLDAGATQLGIAADHRPDYEPCTRNGEDCSDIYAVSLPNVTPSASLTWFQMQQACKNSRKRLPTNAEWQAAVTGTPDPGPDNGTTDCVTGSGAYNNDTRQPTGSRSDCVSTDGAFDMVGNVWEWTADWVPMSSHCYGYLSTVSDDHMCLAGASIDSSYANAPAAIMRGGAYYNGKEAGPLAVSGTGRVIISAYYLGFRCAR